MIVFRKIYAWWILLIWALSYIIVFPFTVFMLAIKAYKPLHNFYCYYWSGTIILFTGLFPKIERRFKIDKKQSYIYIANHTSFVDIIMTFWVIKSYFAIVGKASLNKVPLFGYMFKRLYIPVDRSSRLARYETMKKVYGTLDEGRSIVIYPEGTIPKVERLPNMIKFQDGAFRSAIDKQLPIVPIAFTNHYKIMPDSGQKGARWRRPKAIVLEPIETKGMTMDDIDKLKEMAFNVIDAEIKKHNNL